MRPALIAVAVAAGALLVGAAMPAEPQQFEGIVRIKSLKLSPNLVSAQMGEDEQDAAKAREKIFALTTDQLVQLGATVNEQTMLFKGTRTRTAIPGMPGGGAAYMLSDAASGVLRTVMPSQRGYYETSLRDLLTSSASDSEPGPEPPQVEPLGRTELISGLRCTGYRVTEGDQVALQWTTRDPAYRDLMTQMLQMSPGGRWTTLARALVERYGYPVMTQKLTEDMSYTVEVWSLQRQALADSLFTIPAGFRKLQVPGMR